MTKTTNAKVSKSQRNTSKREALSAAQLHENALVTHEAAIFEAALHEGSSRSVMLDTYATAWSALDDSKDDTFKAEEARLGIAYQIGHVVMAIADAMLCDGEAVGIPVGNLLAALKAEATIIVTGKKDGDKIDRSTHIVTGVADQKEKWAQKLYQNAKTDLSRIRGRLGIAKVGTGGPRAAGTTATKPETTAPAPQPQAPAARR